MALAYDPSAVPQFDGSGNPTVIVKNTFIDLADADDVQPCAGRSMSAPAGFVSCDDAPKLVLTECDGDSTICGESSVDESDSTIGESCGDTDFCQESIVEELSASIAEDKKDLKAATEVRAKENADFIAIEKDLTENVDTLERIIAVVEKELACGATFAQIKGTKGLVQALHLIVAAEQMSGADGKESTAFVQQASQFLVAAEHMSVADGKESTSFVQTENDQCDSEAAFGAPVAAVYDGSSDDIGFDSKFEMARSDEFDEPLAIECDMESSHSLSMIDLASEAQMRDVTSLLPTQSASDAKLVTDVESEAKEWAAWADIEDEEPPAPEPKFLSPIAPPSLVEVDKSLDMMPSDADSNVCIVRWKLQARYFNSTNTTKSSPEFAVSFDSGRSLRFRIGLHPGEDGSNFGSWKKWKGQGRASLKITDEVGEPTSIRFRFVCGSQENTAVLHDFSNNSLKCTNSVNFSSAAEGPDVFVYVEFLPWELPVLQ
jgi:hypothetical protein